MLQVPVFDGLSFDLLSFLQDNLACYSDTVNVRLWRQHITDVETTCWRCPLFEIADIARPHLAFPLSLRQVFPVMRKEFPVPAGKFPVPFLREFTS